MPQLLTPTELADYRRNGIHFPVDVLSPHEVTALRTHYETRSDLIQGRNNQKPHLLFPWLYELVRDPRIVDAVEDMFGPNLFCWASQFFAKPAGHPGYVSWHQDATYWGLSSPDVVTAWVALSPSTRASGCMRVIPGTHHRQVTHEDRFEASNLLSRGQEIAVTVDETAALDVTLQAGQMSLHHVLLFHGSEPNRSNDARIGFAIRYIPTHVHQRGGGERSSAMLVRGVDKYHHFDHETPPEADMHPEAVRRHGEIIDRQLRVLYAGANQRGHLNPGRSVPG